MKKTHRTLTPTLNVVFIVLWAAMALVFTSTVEPHRAAFVSLAGGILGGVAGLMQHWSFGESAGGFSAAATLLEVRRAFKATLWGRRYLRFLYLSKVILLGLAIVLVAQLTIYIVVAYLGGYFSLMFVRELMTLQDTFVLLRLTGEKR